MYVVMYFIIPPQITKVFLVAMISNRPLTINFCKEKKQMIWLLSNTMASRKSSRIVTNTANIQNQHRYIQGSSICRERTGWHPVKK